MDEVSRSALILGGGRSRRMGRDKRLISLQETQTVLAAEVAALQSLHLPTWFAGAAHDGARPQLDGLAILWDLEPFAGPLIALLDAWRVVSGELLVLSADLPQLRSEFLQRILGEAAAHPQAKAVVPSDGKHLQPLCAYYRSGALLQLEELRKAGERSLLAALRRMKTHELHVLEATDEASLCNWNRPSDREEPHP